MQTTQLTQFNPFSNIILASASPRRADLLRQIGLEFQIRPSRVTEPEITHQSPTRAVQELALMKASTVAEGLDSGLVIGADTVVVIDGKVIGKPDSDQHAIEILTRLSGNHHEVITGVALIHLSTSASQAKRKPQSQEVTWAERTTVYFRKLRYSEIIEYVRSGEASDKAGAYGIQGRAAAFVTRIEGCYFNVVGLPVASLVENLRGLTEIPHSIELSANLPDR
ncbi:septum formation inhibitor Maf [Candidatus Poribacteria bacterium]|nr:septum formation inhibitor Maf [Candidatus Poribacteria bacterium]